MKEIDKFQLEVRVNILHRLLLKCDAAMDEAISCLFRWSTEHQKLIVLRREIAATFAQLGFEEKP
jgi:hypothetical protein